MTRNEIEVEYKVKDGRIVSPGKFEGEPIYAVAFWDAALNGMADDDNENGFEFDLTDEDHTEWPELEGCDHILLVESDNGFVECITS